MDQVIINQVAVGIFLLITLWVGLQSKRASSIEEYATAGSSLSSGVLMISLIATLISSRDIWIERSFSKGYITLGNAICTSIMLVLLGWFVFPKLTHFKKVFTFDDIMSRIYGELAGRFVAFISIISCILVIAAQLKYAGEIADILGINDRVIIVVFGLIITFYTYIGGVRSVAYTDLLQFGCVAICSMVFLIIHLTTRGKAIDSIDAPHHYSFWHHPNLTSRFLITFFYSFWPTLLIMPPIIQRVLFFKKKNSIKTTFLGMSITYIAFVCIMFFVGSSLAFRHIVLDRKSLTISKIILMATNNPVGICVFTLLLVSITMSTIDSFLNSASISCICLFPSFFSKNWKQKNQLATALIGVVATFVSLVDYKWSGEYIGYAIIGFSPFLVPFIAGVLGLKGDKKVFFITIIFFLLTFISLIFIFSLNTEFVFKLFSSKLIRKSLFFQLIRISWFIAILAQSVVFFLTHYIVFGGFVWEDRAKNRVKTYSLATIDWLWWTSPVAWADRKAEEYGTEPYWVGLFIYVVYFIPYVTIDRNIMTLTMAIILRVIGVVFVTLLLIESIWRKKYLKYFNLFYYVTIFFCVPFSSIMLSWQDPQGYFTVHNIVLEIILLIMLVDWQTFLSFNIASLLFSMVFQKLWHGYFIPDFGPDAHISLGLNVIYSLAVCLIFARKKQLKYYIEKYNLTKTNEDTTNQLKVQQEAHRQLASSLDPRSSMITEMSKVIERQKQGILDSADVSKLESAIAHLTMVKDKSLEYLPLNPTKTTLQNLLQNVAKELNATGWAEKVTLLLHLQEVMDEDAIRADIPYLQQLLFNSVKYQCKYYQATEVHCTIAPATISYSDAKITNQKKGYQFIISRNKIKPHKHIYHMSQGAPAMSDNKAYLHTNFHITTSHMGVMEVNETKNACVLTYVLLCDVKEIKPKMKPFVDENLQATTLLDDDVDVAFLKFANSKGLDKDLMERALRICKHYHRHQKRHSGELFYLHPVAVATLLLEHTTDPAIIVAGLLHDTIEDTPYTAHQMTVAFGTEVTEIVKDITNLYDQASRKVKIDKQDVFAGLLEKENKKALLVKLLDRKHNLQTIHGHKTIEKQKAVATETLQFFVPIAQKLGKAEIEKEFRSICEGVLKK